MKTDSLLYRFFKTAPSIFFKLINRPELQGYKFESVEVKQTAHRIDGVFLPPENAPESPIFFSEFQFQNDPLIYHRLFAEIFMYLEQNPDFADWQAVVIFPRRSLEPTDTNYYRALLNCPQVQRFYLDELSESEGLPVSLRLLQLIVTPPRTVVNTAKQLITQAETNTDLEPALILELAITTMVYKFPQLSREEIIKMLEIASEAQQTRFYQEAREEGQRNLILRLLNRRFDSIPAETRSRLETLNSTQLEALAEALFDFTSIEDLQQWLQNL